ncbi:substrate-binding domain-containing protein [Aquipseudomonas alcaligenes]|uniref:Membrane protein n=1 Tax=Aquipseudomonas alcaligenes TaxID=43263 RepID=A0AA37CJF3_AQUAC|nr:substrate-binding domain-containing protein [Pseudomonas alcaligenes]BCR24596.1 membrane protein [Pseudomonas alcaligenes]GIZ68946.1 membrane protein [Pseudomonas alcaligenes]GIZ73337.1 membrane protein [Pseudomonas alcaligenes]GIZ77689.1 membrane protein [Pseudomonas alcaligenes]GIZ82039.1 membrane protein [Pseudomonas alcaligenes]
MSRVLPVSDRQSCNHAYIWLILGFICYALPWSVFAAEATTLLRIQGSNTIGAKLGPALVSGLFESQGMSNVRIAKGAENEQSVLAEDKLGRTLQVNVAAHGSGTGFVALQDGSAELAASSRPIKDAEAATLQALGDMRGSAAEQVIAIDGLAIIVHPHNPVQALTTEQLAAVFAGEIKDWSALGGTSGTINLYARDDKSGTFDTFKELVLASQGKSLDGAAKRFESSDQLSDSVSQDPGGIGFIGLPYVRQSKPLAIADGDSQPMLPSTTLIATEDYPLSRRLFLYNPPGTTNEWVQALVQFAHSPAGQAIVAKTGFIPQTVQAVKVEPSAQMPEHYRRLASEAQRLSVNFRFQEGSAELDNKAQRDLARVLDYLKANDKLRQKAVLVGFGDPKNDPARAALLSKLRAMAVRRDLVKGGVIFRDITGLGEQMPVAANDADEGRVKNRRVEVWVY